jgi:hypothetical protein
VIIKGILGKLNVLSEVLSYSPRQNRQKLWFLNLTFSVLNFFCTFAEIKRPNKSAYHVFCLFYASKRATKNWNRRRLSCKVIVLKWNMRYMSPNSLSIEKVTSFNPTFSDLDDNWQSESFWWKNRHFFFKCVT